MTETVNVKVVHLEDCSCAPETVELVRRIAAELKLVVDLESIVVNSQEEADRHRHVGSPTVQVNGLDIDPRARGVELFGLT